MFSTLPFPRRANGPNLPNSPPPTPPNLLSLTHVVNSKGTHIYSFRKHQVQATAKDFKREVCATVSYVTLATTKRRGTAIRNLTSRVVSILSQNWYRPTHFYILFLRHGPSNQKLALSSEKQHWPTVTRNFPEQYNRI